MLRAALAVVVLLAGCGQGGTLIVQVRTDLAPGEMFARVRVTGPGIDGSVEADPTFDWGRGVRVLELELAEHGERRFVVSALDAADAVVVERPVRIDLQGGVRVVTVLLSSRCAGVSCPGSGDPAHAACLAGRCVPENCSEETPEACLDPECETSGDCPVVIAGCAVSECTLSGSCFVALDHSMCPVGLCAPSGRCAAPGACGNGMRDGDETDVDCGGSCTPCDSGLACVASADCVGGYCATGFCSCLESTLAVTLGVRTTDTHAPGFAWTGSSLVIAWNDVGGSVMAEAFDHAGDPVSAEVDLGGANDSAIRAASTDAGAAFVWDTGAGARWVEVDPGARRRGGGFVDTASNPDIAWTGSQLALVWEADGPAARDLLFSFTDGTATPAFTSGADSVDPRLVWAGTQFFTAWNEAGALCLRRLDDMGSLVGAAVCTGDALASALALATDGTDAGVAFGTGTTMSFRNLDNADRLTRREDLADPIALLSPPAIVHAGSDHVVVWNDAGAPQLARVTPSAVETRPINTGSLVPRSPLALAADPGGYFVAYAADGGRGCCDIYLTRLCYPRTP